MHEIKNVTEDKANPWELTLARWFWNHTWTTRMLRPVSVAKASRTFQAQTCVIKEK